MNKLRTVALVWGTFAIHVQAKNLKQAVRRALDESIAIDLDEAENINEYTELVKEVYDIYVFDKDENRIGGNYLDDENIYQQHLGNRFFAKFWLSFVLGILCYVQPLVGMILASLFLLIVFLPYIIDYLNGSEEKEYVFNATGFGALAFTFEAESGEAAADVMKTILELEDKTSNVPEEVEVFMTMNEVTSLYQVVKGEELEQNLVTASRKTFKYFGMPSNWFFIPLGALCGSIANFLL